ncbi:hypothetical protein BJ878DRAFT_562546 [Calycina marina]|uniref:CCHC-type domain-containing protein n=1 Tax=Calycina marina TaxID=1763456 RepID=A0A9P7ZBB5_9HELO|nr:hypothetical protein BJ878DRAFT_562546 [Calycina marina]
MALSAGQWPPRALNKDVKPRLKDDPDDVPIVASERSLGKRRAARDSSKVKREHIGKMVIDLTQLNVDDESDFIDRGDEEGDLSELEDDDFEGDTSEGIIQTRHGVQYFVCETFEIPQVSQPHINNRSTTDLFESLENGSIILVPEYQREAEWNESRASMFICSILMNYFVPPIIFNNKIGRRLNDRGEVSRLMQSRVCIQGWQSLKALRKFMTGQIAVVDKAQKKWYFCHPMADGMEVPSSHTIMPDAVKIFFWQRNLCCYEYSDLPQATEENMFQLLNKDIALTAGGRLLAKATEWAMFARQYEEDYSLILTLSRPERASAYRIVLTTFAMLLETLGTSEKVLGYINGTTIPSFKATPQALEGMLEDKMPINTELRARFKEIFDRFETLVKDCCEQLTATKYKVKVNSIFDATPEFLDNTMIFIFSPIEIVGTAVLVAYHMANRTDAELLCGIKHLRRHLRANFDDLRLNNRCWKAIWEFIRDHPPDLPDFTESESRLRRSKNTRRVLQETEEELSLPESDNENVEVAESHNPNNHEISDCVAESSAINSRSRASSVVKMVDSEGLAPLRVPVEIDGPVESAQVDPFVELNGELATERHVIAAEVSTETSKSTNMISPRETMSLLERMGQERIPSPDAMGVTNKAQPCVVKAAAGAVLHTEVVDLTGDDSPVLRHNTAVGKSVVRQPLDDSVLGQELPTWQGAATIAEPQDRTLFVIDWGNETTSWLDSRQGAAEKVLDNVPEVYLSDSDGLLHTDSQAASQTVPIEELAQEAQWVAGAISTKSRNEHNAKHNPISSQGSGSNAIRLSEPSDKPAVGSSILSPLDSTESRIGRNPVLDVSILEPISKKSSPVVAEASDPLGVAQDKANTNIASLLSAADFQKLAADKRRGVSRFKPKAPVRLMGREGITTKGSPAPASVDFYDNDTPRSLNDFQRAFVVNRLTDQVERSWVYARCYRCGKDGHIRTTCLERLHIDGSVIMDRTGTGDEIVDGPIGVNHPIASSNKATKPLEVDSGKNLKGQIPTTSGCANKSDNLPRPRPFPGNAYTSAVDLQRNHPSVNGAYAGSSTNNAAHQAGLSSANIHKNTHWIRPGFVSGNALAAISDGSRADHIDVNTAKTGSDTKYASQYRPREVPAKDNVPLRADSRKGQQTKNDSSSSTKLDPPVRVMSKKARHRERRQKEMQEMNARANLGFAQITPPMAPPTVPPIAPAVLTTPVRTIPVLTTAAEWYKNSYRTIENPNRNDTRSTQALSVNRRVSSGSTSSQNNNVRISSLPRDRYTPFARRHDTSLAASQTANDDQWMRMFRNRITFSDASRGDAPPRPISLPPKPNVPLPPEYRFSDKISQVSEDHFWNHRDRGRMQQYEEDRRRGSREVSRERYDYLRRLDERPRPRWGERQEYSQPVWGREGREDEQPMLERSEERRYEMNRENERAGGRLNEPTYNLTRGPKRGPGSLVGGESPMKRQRRRSDDFQRSGRNGYER